MGRFKDKKLYIFRLQSPYGFILHVCPGALLQYRTFPSGALSRTVSGSENRTGSDCWNTGAAVLFL